MTDIPEYLNPRQDENGQLEDCFGNTIRPYHTRRQVEHGKTCAKIPHLTNGFVHADSHDGPYKVGLVSYCGRCHEMLP